ncbi:hypothetical protein RRF57_000480 [Xylaria bambusicola]|uniref:Uncharacterized protein n=1 Tax=Xylaria bambusicola TaxID=326684 RepID=A0AAN7UEM9_9PEZI
MRERRTLTRIEERQDILASSKGSERHATTDVLPERGKIGVNAQCALDAAAVVHARRHDFVEDE